MSNRAQSVKQEGEPSQVEILKSARLRNQLQFNYEKNNNLLDAKSERRKADWDAQLLLNRISLLESEKLKFQKKIQETQKKTEEIWNIKKRNFEHEKQKEEFQRKQKENMLQQMHKNMVTKEKIRNNIFNQRVNQVKQIHQESATVKKTLHDFCQIKQYMREDEISKKAQNAQKVKEIEKFVEDKNRWLWKQKLLKNKDSYESRLEQELQHLDQREKDIKALEKKEFDLLAVLQQSQDLQQQALNKLKQVASLNMRISDLDPETTGFNSKSKKPNSSFRSASVPRKNQTSY